MEPSNKTNGKALENDDFDLSLFRIQRKSLGAIENIWSGMKGEIVIIHSAWNKAKVIEKLARSLNSPQSIISSRINELNIPKDKAYEVFKIFTDSTSYSNLLPTGDFYALSYITEILNWLYPPNIIDIKNAWDFGFDDKSVIDNKEF